MEGQTSGRLHTYSSCDGPNKANGTIYDLYECSDGSIIDANAKVGKGSSSCGGPGAVGIAPSAFENLAFVLELSIAQTDWLNANCDKKNEIYSYLNRYSVNGKYLESAKDFAKEVIEANEEDTAVSSFPLVKYPEDKAAFYRSEYPKLTEYLENQLPKIADNPTIVNAFKQYTNMTDAQVRETLTWGDGPNLLVEQLGLDNRGNPISGKFEEPDILKIDIDMVNFLENSTSGSEYSETILLAIGMTILHEAVHYGDYNYNNDFYTGNNPYTNEEGWLFEQEVYEFSIFVSASGEFTIIPWN